MAAIRYLRRFLCADDGESGKAHEQLAIGADSNLPVEAAVLAAAGSSRGNGQDRERSSWIRPYIRAGGSFR